jgi:hypothetical protein
VVLSSIRRRRDRGRTVEIFRPALELADDEQSVQSWATSEGGRYYALGRDSTVTSKRVLEVVVDDPMTAADRRSKAARDEVYTWLDESLMSRVDGDGPIIVVAQRLDRDDIHARCMASGHWWRILEPAAERDDRGLELRDHAGELVWRDDRARRADRAADAHAREARRASPSPSRHVQYQQRPEEDAGGGTIARDAWRFHARARCEPERATPGRMRKPADSPTVVTPDGLRRIVISCDPTFGGTKTENDFCSIQVWGRAHDDRSATAIYGYFLLARWHERAKQLAQREGAQALREQFPDAAVRIENTAGGPGMVEDLEAEGMLTSR